MAEGPTHTAWGPGIDKSLTRAMAVRNLGLSGGGRLAALVGAGARGTRVSSGGRTVCHSGLNKDSACRKFMPIEQSIVPLPWYR